MRSFKATKRKIFKHKSSSSIRGQKILPSGRLKIRDIIGDKCSDDEQDVTDIIGDTAEKETLETDCAKIWHDNFEHMHYHALPSWLRDNDYILQWHRPPMPSFQACFKSIFRQHTETGNIWTHMLGCFLIAALTLYFYVQPPHIMSMMDKLVFGIFFGGSMLCLGFSSIHHILACHSKSVRRCSRKLDYCGIVIFMTGTYIPWLYYVFYHDVISKVIYSFMVSIMCMICMFASFNETFAKSDLRGFRCGLFSIFGVSGFLPIMQYIIIEGSYALSSATWLLLSGIMYAMGAIIYCSRIPERYFPGQFDVWFQSHQIFHVLVVVGLIFNYIGMHDIAFKTLIKKFSSV